MPGRKKTRSFRNLVLLGVVLVTFGAIFCTSKLLTKNMRVGPVSNRMVHKMGHVVVYGGLALLLAKGLRGRYLAAGAIVVAFGAVEEVHQLFVPGRSPKVSDVVLNVVIVTAVLTAAYLVETRRGRRVAAA